MSQVSVSQLAYILALIGGILLVVFGLLSFFEASIQSYGPVLTWGYSYGAVVAIICGIIALIGARSASTLVWAIILIIVGIIGGGLGGLLVVLGGIVGLIVVVSKKA